jgi:hypothetical protein
LAPLAIAPANVMGPPSWQAAASSASAAGAASAIFVTGRIAGSQLTAELTEVTAQGAPRPLGTVSAALTVGEGGMAPSLQRLAEAANARIQAEWKSKISSGDGAAPERTRVAATAQYSDPAQWRRIKQALSTATIVSEIRIEAVARDGAMVAFSYLGTADQLRAELGRSGVVVAEGPQGPILRVGG